MESLQNEVQRRVLMGFFKTGPGEYGEGDEFLGLKVPQTREVVKLALTIDHELLPLRSRYSFATPSALTINEVPELLMSKWHEVRLCGLLILVAKFSALAERPKVEREKLTKRTAARTPLECTEETIRGRDEILTMYLQYAEQANNWDLVDLSAPKILGHWLLLPSNLGMTDSRIHGITESANTIVNRDCKIRVLDDLAQSDNLWKQRMSIVCTWKTSQMGDPSWCLRYAEIHLHHPHDLMHKAVGWMLREMGKRCSMELLRDFLRQHAHEMPRTMLRYAIEKMPEQERQEWMRKPSFAAEPRSTVEVGLTRNKRVLRFAGVPVPDFVEMILKGDDEAMYYLLHDRLKRPLHERYEAYKDHLCDDYEDVIDDFFLYLHENGRYPYQALQRIKKKDSFEAWLLNTFRNYLSNRAEAEGGAFSSQPNCEAHSPIMGQGGVGDEEKIRIVSQLIAYAHQVFYPRGRFIFLRSLLTMLNKQRAVPNKEMAEALDMSDLAYRVAVYRMKQNVKRFRERLLKGETFRLDDEHQQMADHINRDFIHLYPTLFRIYLQSIDSLKTSTAVKHLRQQYLEERSFVVHEPDADNSIRARILAFWAKLNRWMIT